MLVGSVMVGVVMIVTQRTGPKKLLREGRERYLDYIEELRHALRATIAAQRKSSGWRHPPPGYLPDVARTTARRWERRRTDADHLVVRVGVGDQPIATELAMNADTGPLNQFDQVCLEAAKNLRDRYSVLHDEPVTLDLRHLGVVSVVGDRSAARELAMAMAAQLVTLHSPSDVSLGVVRADQLAAQWDWVKWLPHCQSPRLLDGDVPARLVTTSPAAMADLLSEELARRLEERSRTRGRVADPREHLVLVIDGEAQGNLRGLESPDPTVTLAEAWASTSSTCSAAGVRSRRSSTTASRSDPIGSPARRRGWRPMPSTPSRRGCRCCSPGGCRRCGCRSRTGATARP